MPSADPAQKVSEYDMQFYYENLLPFKHIFKWLNHSDTVINQSFANREFAYEYRNGAYQRYNSYSSLAEFKSSVVKSNPTRFEIGAVYAVNPRNRKTLPKSAMKPIEKDLVFDIDLTDYDGIRTCCSGTDICGKCWKFITVGSQIIEAALREDFGFDDLIWVFSGRRGAHCWVSDNQARKLSEPQRRAVVEYLDVLGKRKGNRNGLNLRRPLHPHVSRSLNILKSKFKDIILDEQNPWQNDDVAFSDLLPMISDKKFSGLLQDYWTSHPNRSTREKWSDIKTIYEKNSKIFSVNQFQSMREDIIIESLYPRLDIEVSRQLIHLLKSPFCIHPGTGNVCVPFDAAVMYQDYENELNDTGKERLGFDPSNAPNLHRLLREFDENKGKKDDDSWNNTSLKLYVELFEKFVTKLATEEAQLVRKRKLEE